MQFVLNVTSASAMPVPLLIFVELAWLDTTLIVRVYASSAILAIAPPAHNQTSVRNVRPHSLLAQTDQPATNATYPAVSSAAQSISAVAAKKISPSPSPTEALASNV